MFKRIFLIFLLANSLIILIQKDSYANTNRAQIDRPLYVKGEILLRLKPGATLDDIDAIHRKFNTRTIRYFAFIGLFHLKLPTNLTVDNAIQALQQDSLVEYVLPNNLYYLDDVAFPDDPRFGEMWGLHNTGQAGGIQDADIDAPEAWDINTGSNEVIIAVIDSGVDLEHEDLAANIWTNPGEIPGNGMDDDNNGFIDDVHGWDFSSNDNDPSPAGGGCVGHGTHVAGTIGAVGNNSVGITGVNWNVTIMPLKAFEPVSGIFCAARSADLIAAIQYHTMMGVRISSNSWGGTFPSLAMINAIRASNSIFVAAAGNGGLDAVGDNNDTVPQYPSNYRLDNIIAVAATDRTDSRASFSNFGFRSVDLGAPGLSVLSTLPNNRYGNLSGTSMATPHVAGVAGLLLGQDPTLTNKEIKWRILNGTDDIGLPVLTRGRLNANNALRFGISTPAVTVNVTPLGPTHVSIGDLAFFRINIVNHDTSPITVKSKIYVQFKNGFELSFYRKTDLLDAGGTINRTLVRRIPLYFTTGTTFNLFVQAETSKSFDEDWVEYTVVPHTTISDLPAKLYLPVIIVN